MKRVAAIVSFFVLSLAFGVGFLNAQPMGPSDYTVRGPQAGDAPCMMRAEHDGDMEQRDMEQIGGMGMMREHLMEMRHHVMEMMLSLGLDQKQKEAVHELVDKTVKELIKKKSDMLITSIDLEDILEREPIDMNAAEAKLKELEAIKTDMFMTHLKSFEEIKSTLTPEQREKLKAMMGMHMMPGREMMEHKRRPHDEKKMTK